jgi:hypothetical protein
MPPNPDWAAKGLAKARRLADDIIENRGAFGQAAWRDDFADWQLDVRPGPRHPLPAIGPAHQRHQGLADVTATADREDSHHVFKLSSNTEWALIDRPP